VADPKSLGYRMPAEWEPHEGTWLSWPHNPRTWVGNFGPIPSVFAQIVKALCPHENVHICVRDAFTEASVRQILKAAGCDSERVRFYSIPTNDAWARDHGPTFVVQDPARASSSSASRSAILPGLESGVPEKKSSARLPQPPLAVIDWKFNAWGEKYPPWDDDDAVPERISQILKLPCFSPRMVLEGGAIDVNGKGTVLTTECVMLNPNRNPALNRKQIEDRLDEYLAARHVVWLGDGIVGDDTDGHIDDLARFINPTTVATIFENDSSDVNYRALNENFERLQGAKDQDGAKLEIVKLPTPGKLCRGATHGERGPEERLPASYANFYIANGAVLVPTFEHANDKKAMAILQDFFPDREMIGIPCRDLVGGYGAIHCVTQQQPLGG
jgi:agmatine deiminase